MENYYEKVPFHDPCPNFAKTFIFIGKITKITQNITQLCPPHLMNFPPDNDPPAYYTPTIKSIIYINVSSNICLHSIFKQKENDFIVNFALSA